MSVLLVNIPKSYRNNKYLRPSLKITTRVPVIKLTRATNRNFQKHLKKLILAPSTHSIQQPKKEFDSVCETVKRYLGYDWWNDQKVKIAGYADLIKKYGHSPDLPDYGRAESQIKKFRVL